MFDMPFKFEQTIHALSTSTIFSCRVVAAWIAAAYIIKETPFKYQLKFWEQKEDTMG